MINIMCLAIPMQVMLTDGAIARCSANGIEREVSLYLMPPDSVVPGDFVIVHVGYAIQKVSREDAESMWETVGSMLGQEARNA